MVAPGARQDLTVAGPEATQARAERSDAADAPVPAPGSSIGAAGAESSAGAATPPPASPAPAGKPAPAQLGNDSRTAAPSADLGRTAASDQARPGASAENRAREEAPAERQALAKQQSADTLARANEGKPEALKEPAVTGVTPAAESPQAARAAPAPPRTCGLGWRGRRLRRGQRHGGSVARRHRALAAGGSRSRGPRRPTWPGRHDRAQRRWRRHLAAGEHRDQAPVHRGGCAISDRLLADRAWRHGGPHDRCAHVATAFRSRAGCRPYECRGERRANGDGARHARPVVSHDRRRRELDPVAVNA